MTASMGHNIRVSLIGRDNKKHETIGKYKCGELKAWDRRSSKSRLRSLDNYKKLGLRRLNNGGKEDASRRDKKFRNFKVNVQR